MSTQSTEALPAESSALASQESVEDESSDEVTPTNQQQPIKQILRYSTSTLFALRSSKLSQQKPACKNMDLSCMAHHKPPPKMLVANMMPKFALNQMPNRGEESISPLSFHSNSSSSSNLSYQKRYQEGNSGGGGGDGYSSSRYYYNKYKNHDDNNGGGSSRIIYKTTGANAGNGNSIRFLKKAYNSKYEEEGNSLGLISNKNILDNANRVITAADHRNSIKKKLEDDDAQSNDKGLNEKTNNEDKDKKSPTDEANNNAKESESTKLTEVNANDLMVRNDLKNLPDNLDISNHLDDIFNDININKLLDEKITDERGSSRFSKWFKVNEETKEEKPLPDTQNNNTSENKHSSLFQHETEKYFQPIDKVENNSLFQIMKGQQPEMQRNDPLMSMLQNNQPQSQKSPNSGQVHSVEELEAKLRQHKLNEEHGQKANENEKKVLQNFFQQQFIPNLMQQQQIQQPAPHVGQNQEDINAFKKLLQQITNDDPKTSSPQQMMAQNGQNMLQQLMNKNFPPNPEMMMQYQKNFPMGGKMTSPNAKMVNPLSGNSPHVMQPQQQFGGNLDMKFMQQQPKMNSNVVPDIGKRPEVQALVQELTSGEISQYNLWQRLTAPGLSAVEREIITCALNIFNANSNNGNIGMFSKQPGNMGNIFAQGPGAIGTPQNPNASTQALHQLMQQQIKTNALSAPIPIPSQTSPLSPVPPLDQHLLFQHQAAVAANKQLRLSPLPTGFSMGPASVLPPSNALTLHVPGMPQRIPSPRELQYHTQSIMQNALIRKKLEEQRENFRKRQEQEKQENAKKTQHDTNTSSDGSSADQNSSNNLSTSQQQQQQQQQEEIMKLTESPTKKAPSAQHQIQIQRQHAPSPNIFTPTSVLRKMTAEKENDPAKLSNATASNARIDDKKKLMSSIQSQSQIRNQQQQQFMNSIGNLSQMERMKMQKNEGVFGGGLNAWEFQQMQNMKPAGRPIVKASASQHNSMHNANSGGGPSMMTQSNSMNFDFQQQQMQKMNLEKAQFLQQQQMLQMKKQQMDNPVLSQFMAQQQQRAQAQSQFRSQFQQPQSSMNNFPMMQGRPEKTTEEMENRNILNGQCLSPTSNQLAKWFSPELLADASAGKLLPSLNVGQMMSLEELEKCMQNS